MQEQSTHSARTVEETILELVRVGALSIDAEGRVWRHGRYAKGTLYPFSEPSRTDHPDPAGYRCVKVVHDGKRVTVMAHRIQWLVCRGPIPEGAEVNHKDLDKANNHIDNLELATHAENLGHAKRSGAFKNAPNKGEGHYHGKLNWERVRFIRAKVKAKEMTQAALAEMFKVSAPVISQVVRNKIWKAEDDPANR